MEKQDKQESVNSVSGTPDLRSAVREALHDYMTMEQAKAEPAYKAELVEERSRREDLERRLNELVQENRRTKAQADEAERSSSVRAELQRLGVTKLDLAYKAVKDEIVRRPEGRLVAQTHDGELSVREYLQRFVNENPELLPARIQGASGVPASHKVQDSGAFDIDRIKPGMSAEDLDKVRREIARIAQASHNL